MKTNREGYKTDGVSRECTKCHEIFTITSKTVTLCPKCNTARVTGQTPEQRMYRRAKVRAKLRGHEFSIELHDIVIPEVCPILGMPLKVHVGRSGGAPYSPALDRIDNTKGYIPGNVMVMSHLANQMKSSATNKQLRTFADWVHNNLPAGPNDSC